MKAHLFVDESKSGAYLLVVACALPAELAPSRRRMNQLLLPGQRRLHFTSERDSRRHQIVDCILELGVRATIYQGPQEVRELAARQACIERLGRDAIAQSAELIVFEVDDSLIDHDRRTLRRVLLGPDGQPLVRYEHLRPHEESLLWIPDAIAWCWAKGGSWRKLVVPAVDGVVKL